MRIQILSDLHLEVRPIDLPDVYADVVVLAGDIANGAAGIEWAKRTFAGPVLYVAGNHEYYDGEYHTIQEQLKTDSAGTRINLLDCQETRIGSVRFLGCSLWTDLHPGAAGRAHPGH